MAAALTDTDVARFQALCKARFNAELDKDTAYRKLSLLVLQMKSVYKPITKQQANEYVNKDEDCNGESEKTKR